MSTIENKIGTVFLPVSNIEESRDWYCRLLGIQRKGDIQFGHLYVIELEGVNLVLDQKIFQKTGPLQAPIFHLNAVDIEKAYNELRESNVEVTTTIQHGHWFNFKDPDGNEIMVCQC
ncbi:VOC family protein [Sporosarcina contaminans]|uniref:VOC family protein n=1 Tax=Sporosarcina contaminans TaxID=633403 RepID=A0ABW3U1E9_9BACL